MNGKHILPIGMVFQFLLTVCGGGLFIAGLIGGFYFGWDFAAEDNKSAIALLMVIFGAVLFVLGVLVAVFLYKVMTIQRKDTEKEKEEAFGKEGSEEDSDS